MCPSVEEGIRKIELIIYIIIVVVFLGAFLNVPSFITNWIVEWLISAIVGSVFSLVAGVTVEAFTGEFLKKYAFTIYIGSLKFSITAFAVATFVVKLVLFKRL